jgi:ABC-2 type transport system ATP-binding protein
MSDAIRVEDLVKVFAPRGGTQVRAVDGISFRVGKGELFSLLGPNGAGKTTTISMLSGLIEPTHGSIDINGISVTRDPIGAKRQIGIVPQEVALYPRLTARQNLEFFGRMYGLSGSRLRRRVDELLEFVELAERGSDRVETFSGGMKRRINIAAGLLHEPPILYMDEPTVGVDPQSRRRILDLIEHLKAELGIAILYTTHLMEEAEELSDRVGIIDHGKLIAVGTQVELTALVNEYDRIEIELDEAAVPGEYFGAIERLEGVEEVRPGGDDEEAAAGHTTVVILASSGRRLLPALVEVSNRQGRRVSSLRLQEPNLESVFLSLTGRALRE